MRGAVLRVDETVVYATDAGAAYWSDWRRAHRPERFHVIAANPMGETVEVECDGREHAEWLMGFLAGKGVPLRAMRITRPAPTPPDARR